MKLTELSLSPWPNQKQTVYYKVSFTTRLKEFQPVQHWFYGLEIEAREMGVSCPQISLLVKWQNWAGS